MDMSITSASDTDLSDYDIISSPAVHMPQPSEPAPSPIALAQLKGTLELTSGDIQSYISTHLGEKVDKSRTVRVYVDGTFEGFHAGHAHQLRQAKLSFPSVHLIVGVLPSSTSAAYAETLELLRHIRWVDQVMASPPAPLQLDSSFIKGHSIDYVAVEEGVTVDPRVDKARLKGYDSLKALGKIIPTRRTLGISPPTSLRAPSPLPLPPPAAITTTPTISRKEHLPPTEPEEKPPSAEQDNDTIPEPLDIYGIDSPLQDPMDVYGIGT